MIKQQLSDILKLQWTAVYVQKSVIYWILLYTMSEIRHTRYKVGTGEYSYYDGVVIALSTH